MNTTKTSPQEMVLPLPRNIIRQVNHYKKIVCEKGILWLTQSGDPGDYILMPGDQFAGLKHRKVLVEALHDAVLRIDK